jgi:hypothetical protein
MRYTPPPPSEAGTLPIYYNEVSLDSNALQNLNFAPYDLVPAVADFFIVPIWFQIFARIDTADNSQNVYIGNLNALLVNQAYYYSLLNLSTTIPGELNLILPVQQTPPVTLQPKYNTVNGAALSLWMQIDDPTFIASTFNVRTAYYLTPNY